MEINISSSQKEEMIDITGEIKRLVQQADIVEGICSVFIKGTTSSIIINENYDPNICLDILERLRKLVPDHDNYLHDKVDNNAAAHIKAAILGPGENIPVKQGKINLGKWQAIMLVEFDGPRQRQISIQIIPD